MIKCKQRPAPAGPTRGSEQLEGAHPGREFATGGLFCLFVWVFVLFCGLVFVCLFFVLLFWGGFFCELLQAFLRLVYLSPVLVC